MSGLLGSSSRRRLVDGFLTAEWSFAYDLAFFSGAPTRDSSLYHAMLQHLMSDLWSPLRWTVAVRSKQMICCGQVMHLVEIIWNHVVCFALYCSCLSQVGALNINNIQMFLYLNRFDSIRFDSIHSIRFKWVCCNTKASQSLVDWLEQMLHAIELTWRRSAAAAFFCLFLLGLLLSLPNFLWYR